MLKFKLLFLSISIAVIYSCKENNTAQNNNSVLKNWSKDKSTTLNKNFVLEQELAILSYLKRKTSYKTIKTGTGLHYWIYKDSVGDTAKDGDLVSVNFEIKLLDESIAYSSKKNKPYRFKVAKAEVESGVQEGIKFLSEGDKAKFIIPSHLAHGLVGDFDKIPPLQVLVIDIELIKIN